jgi:hypothetical protein
MVSTQHGSATPIAGSIGGPFGECYQQTNPNPQRETMRALWKAFTDWVRDGVRPPPSAVPRLRDRTLVLPSEVNFPSIPANDYEGISRPAVTFLALANPLRARDWGPLFNNEDESGIITTEPPHAGTRQYTILVPQVNADGNDLGGVRSATLQAPLGTYTGWNLGRADRWPNHLCSLQGSLIPFARTQGRAPGGRRPPPLAGRAIRKPRGVCGRCPGGRRAAGEPAPAPACGRGAADQRGGGERRAELTG